MRCRAGVSQVTTITGGNVRHQREGARSRCKRTATAPTDGDGVRNARHRTTTGAIDIKAGTGAARGVRQWATLVSSGNATINAGGMLTIQTRGPAQGIYAAYAQVNSAQGMTVVAVGDNHHRWWFNGTDGDATLPDHHGGSL